MEDTKHTRKPLRYRILEDIDAQNQVEAEEAAKREFRQSSQAIDGEPAFKVGIEYDQVTQPWLE